MQLLLETSINKFYQWPEKYRLKECTGSIEAGVYSTKYDPKWRMHKILAGCKMQEGKVSPLNQVAEIIYVNIHVEYRLEFSESSGRLH